MKNLKFVIQENLIDDDSLLQIKNCVEKYPHIYVGVIPFSREITHENGELEGNDFIPYGSTLLTILTSDLGWKGLFFDINRFNYKSFLENRDDMLNDNVMEITEAIKFLKNQDPESEWFVRPSNDLKQFTGMVDTVSDLLDWFKDAMECDSSGSYKIEEGTEIVVSTPKNIQAEWRWFIVNGKVISGSMYRHKGVFCKERVYEQDIIDEAQYFADKWLPHETCVMDLALYNDELKVIEFNCFNSSGFYDNDIEAVFDSIAEYMGINKGT